MPEKSSLFGFPNVLELYTWTMQRFEASVSAKEQRLCRREAQPYLDQWWRETKGYQMLKLGDDPVSKTGEVIGNIIGKVAVGATTVIDRTVDRFTNPNPPEPLRNDDLLPRAQRDTRQLVKGIFSKNTLKHPIGTVLSSGVRVFGIATSALTDGAQKLGGGKNLAV